MANLSNISLVATIRGAGSPNYLNYPNGVFVATISGTEYAFVASMSDNALTIFDVSDPYNPTQVRFTAWLRLSELPGRFSTYSYRWNKFRLYFGIWQ
ncbi:MAG: hypothetical protein ACYS1A_17560 [Planctomycetota bacterium]|jgi:hypothetical protein